MTPATEEPPRSDGLLSQHQINRPAASDVNLLRVAAVREDIVAVAAGVLQRVRQNRHRAELARLVHGAREGNRGIRAPLRGEGYGAERVPEDVAQEIALSE